MRLVSLPTRGTWEADQGHDMLILRGMVQDGIVPLVGPPTSIGDLHHGPWYYYVLSPGAALTGGDSPLTVVILIALAGIGAVAAIWWLARVMGGPVAGAVAGLAAAVSATSIESSTFIWNPNLIALSSAIGLAGAWSAWSGRDRRWWLAAAVGVALTMQFHVLGVALLPIVAVPYVLDARRRPLGRVHVGVLAIFAIAYLPLLINELTTGGSEVRAALEYLGAGGAGNDMAIPVRFVIVGLRVLSWPLTGLITDGFLAGLLASAAVIAVAIWRSRANGPGSVGRPVAWARTPLVDRVPDDHRSGSGHGRSRAPHRSLPRVRGSDGLHARRARRGGTGRPCGRGSWRITPHGRPGPGRCRPGGRGGLEPDAPAARRPSGRRLSGRGGGGRSCGWRPHGGRRGARRRGPDPVRARLQVDRGDGLPAGPSRAPVCRRCAGWRGSWQRLDPST